MKRFQDTDERLVPVRWVCFPHFHETHRIFILCGGDVSAGRSRIAQRRFFSSLMIWGGGFRLLRRGVLRDPEYRQACPRWHAFHQRLRRMHRVLSKPCLAILSGRYPARLHLADWIAGHKRRKAKPKIPDRTMKPDHKRVLLPEVPKEAGCSTAFLGKWHLMPNGQPDMKEHLPTVHGFEINIGGREWVLPKGSGKCFSLTS